MGRSVAIDVEGSNESGFAARSVIDIPVGSQRGLIVLVTKLASQNVDHRAISSVRENSHYNIDVFIGEERCTTPCLAGIRVERWRGDMRRHYGKRRRAVLEDRAVVQDVTSGIRGWEGSGCESRGVTAAITHRRIFFAYEDTKIKKILGS